MISALDQSAWDEKALALGGGILQSWIWGEFQKSLGLTITRFSGDDFLSLLIETPLPFGKTYAYAPRGPVGNASKALSDFRNFFAHDKNVIFTRLEPNERLDLPQAPQAVQPQYTWVLDITPPEDTLLIGMKPKHRYNLNLAQRKGVVVREGEKKDLLKFWQLLLETADRQKFRLHPQAYYWQMWETLSSRHLKLMLAEYQGKLLAGMLLSVFGNTATYLHGGSSSALKQVMAPFLLHWQGIKLAKNLGCRFYDFGGIAHSSGHEWAGITRFKQGFGGFEVGFPPAYDLVFSPLWYNVYKNARALRKIFR